MQGDRLPERAMAGGGGCERTHLSDLGFGEGGQSKKNRFPLQGPKFACSLLWEAPEKENQVPEFVSPPLSL